MHHVHRRGAGSGAGAGAGLIRAVLARWLAPRRAPLATGWSAGRFTPRRTRRLRSPRAYDYCLFVPGGITRWQRVPLLVMLHGCSQDAQSFAAGTRMNELAARQRFMVLYPQQSSRANPLRCWNWFDPERAGAAEAAALAELIQHITRCQPVDPARVYLAGLSAGAAMTAMLALGYGSLFAACASVAGLACGAARSAFGAAQAMRGGAQPAPELAAVAAVRGNARAAFVPALIMHGDDDHTVHPRNAAQLIAQFGRFAELMRGDALRAADERLIRTSGRRYRQRDYTSAGELALRVILVEGLGHAWSGGDASLPFNDAADPDASALIWQFLAGFRRAARRRGPLPQRWARWLNAGAARWARALKA